jgi:hypothetical protein
MPSNWFYFKRVEPVTGKLKENEDKKTFLMKALRSKKAQDIQIGVKLQEFIEKNSDPLVVGNFIDDVLSDDSCKMDINDWIDTFTNKMGNPLDPDPQDKPNTKTGDDLPKLQTAAQDARPRGTREVEKKDVNPGTKALQQIAGLATKLNTGGTLENSNINAAQAAGANTGSGSNIDPIASNTNVNPGSIHIPGSNAFSRQTDITKEGLSKDKDGNDIVTKVTRKGFGMNMSDMKAVDENTNYIDPSVTQDIRSYDKEAGPPDLDVLYNAENKLRSNIEFEQFSYVPPGFGNGVDNKLFRMDNNRKRKIEWNNPMYKPRAYDGPESGITPLPPQWKNTMDAKTYFNGVAQLAQEGINKKKSKTAEQFSVLSNDLMSTRSEKLLPNRSITPYLPVIFNNEHFKSTRIPCGSQLDTSWRQFHRKEHTHRHPEEYIHQEKVMNSLPEHISKQGILGINWMQ